MNNLQKYILKTIFRQQKYMQHFPAKLYSHRAWTQSQATIGPPHQRNAILMAFRWWVNIHPLLSAYRAESSSLRRDINLIIHNKFHRLIDVPCHTQECYLVHTVVTHDLVTHHLRFHTLFQADTHTALSAMYWC